MEEARDHFSRLLEDVRQQSREREEHFLRIISTLEEANIDLEDEVETLNLRCEERQAQVRSEERQREALEAEAKRAHDALEEFTKKANYERDTRHHALTEKINVLHFDVACEALWRDEAESRAVLVAEYGTRSTEIAVLHGKGLLEFYQIASSLVAKHRWSELNVVADEEKRARRMLEECSSAHLEILTQYELEAKSLKNEKRRYVDSLRYSLQLFTGSTSSKCIEDIGGLVVEEDAEWASLIALTSALASAERSGVTSAAPRDVGEDMTLDPPINHNDIFWECCLEEAQHVVRCIDSKDDNEVIVKELCERVEFPILIESLRKKTPLRAYQDWRRIVAQPLKRTALGECSVEEFYNCFVKESKYASAF